jgi:transketolase
MNATKVTVTDYYGRLLIEAAGQNENMVVCEADLSKASGTNMFADAFPDRFFQIGIAEQNMIGICAGLASCGKIPFAHTLAPFATKRTYEQISVSVAYNNLKVRIVGSYSGITTGRNGGTHQSIEDIAIMRVMPNMKIIIPADAMELKLAMKVLLTEEGPVYLRLPRGTMPILFSNDYQFNLGRANIIREGKDLTIIATGVMVAKALSAANILDKDNINVKVINLATIKPLDKEAIIKAAKETGAILTVENHSIIGGLGGAVAEVLSEERPTRMLRMGLPDCFGETGPDEDDYMFHRFRLTTEDIVNNAKRLIKIRDCD